MDTASYFQSPASFLTPATIRFGVMVGPDGNLRDSSCPVARILTWVPPRSIASTFMMNSPHASCAEFDPRCVMRDMPYPSSRILHPVSRILLALTRLLHGRALGCNHTHELVPGGDERLGPFFLKLGGQGIDVDAGLGELIQYRLALAAVGRHDFTDFSVIGQRF